MGKKRKAVKVETSMKSTIRKLSPDDLAKLEAEREQERNVQRIREAVNHPGWFEFAVGRVKGPNVTDEELLLRTFGEWSETWRVFREGWDACDEQTEGFCYD